MQAAKVVTIIPANKNLFSNLELNSVKRKKVAGYGRVSTSEDEQLSSYEAQISYYTKYIKSNPEWEFVKVYADEGITGTSTKRRDEFKEMIKDALDGKVDLIITKSVARFARNTVDTLVTVRKLKENGIEVFFEQESIGTLDSKAELLLTIMSSIAQEEARKISENVTWGKRKTFADGKVSMPYKNFLGYERDENGHPKIVEKEAEIVKLIYRLFLEGKSPSAIVKILTNTKIFSPTGKTKWYSSTIKSILTNEKYKGDAILQKCYTVDFLTKKRKKNEGEVPQYYIENSHESIIDPEIFEVVQNEMKVRALEKRSHSSIHIFASKLICEDCESYFGSKLWHSTDKYKCRIWQCNNKFRNRIKCRTPHLKEKQIKDIFVKAFKKLMYDKSDVITGCIVILDELYDTSKIDLKISELMSEKHKIEKSAQDLVLRNAQTLLNQNTYNDKYSTFSSKFVDINQRIMDLEKQKIMKDTKRCQMERFLEDINKANDLINEFDEQLWFSLVKFVKIGVNGDAGVIFKNGHEIKLEF